MPHIHDKIDFTVEVLEELDDPNYEIRDHIKYYAKAALDVECVSL